MGSPEGLSAQMILGEEFMVLGVGIGIRGDDHPGPCVQQLYPAEKYCL